MARRNMTKQTKKRLGIAVVLILIIGGLLMVQRRTPFDIFLTKDYTIVTKDEQIAYLKQHEQKMTDYVMSENSKVTSVQWDWDSLKIEAGGGPITSNNWIAIEAKFNNIKDSSFMAQWPLKDEKYFPKISDIFLSQPLRVNGGTKIYE